MYVALYEYLLINNELPVPNLGTFFLERKSAVMDFPNKIIHPPVYSIRHDPSLINDNVHLLNWLSVYLNSTVEFAKNKFEEFTGAFKKDQVIEWKGMGTIRKKGGKIVFIPEGCVQGPSIPANKVLREKAHHLVRVGEEEKTSVQMEEILSVPSAGRKSTWWVLALALGILSVIFIGWYFSEHGVNTYSTANTKRAMVDETNNY